jgi:hypothetical protein
MIFFFYVIVKCGDEAPLMNAEIRRNAGKLVSSAVNRRSEREKWAQKHNAQNCIIHKSV